MLDCRLSGDPDSLLIINASSVTYNFGAHLYEVKLKSLSIFLSLGLIGFISVL